MRKPDQIFWVVEDIGTDNHDNHEAAPRRIYFGREVGRGAREHLISRLDLKKREYLGPTSMDHEIALLMANMAHARPGALVLDPFVGTGSNLIACGIFGAHCFGTDIDIRVLKGKKGTLDL